MTEKKEEKQERFYRYEDENASKKILLAKLIAYGYSMNEVEKITREKEEYGMGSYAIKLYAYTKENIDFTEIDNDFRNVNAPQIVSINAFESTVTAETIYMYQPSENTKDGKFCINDFGVLSPVMVINPNCIVSAKKAVPVEEATERGFMHFANYVLYNFVTIDNWTFSYADDVFKIVYTENKSSLVLLEYVGISKRNTYKTVIFLLKKLGNSQEEIFPDNFRTSVLKIIDKY